MWEIYQLAWLFNFILLFLEYTVLGVITLAAIIFGIWRKNRCLIMGSIFLLLHCILQCFRAVWLEVDYLFLFNRWGYNLDNWVLILLDWIARIVLQIIYLVLVSVCLKLTLYYVYSSLIIALTRYHVPKLHPKVRKLVPIISILIPLGLILLPIGSYLADLMQESLFTYVRYQSLAWRIVTLVVNILIVIGGACSYIGNVAVVLIVIVYLGFLQMKMKLGFRTGHICLYLAWLLVPLQIYNLIFQVLYYDRLSLIVESVLEIPFKLMPATVCLLALMLEPNVELFKERLLPRQEKV